VVGEQHLASGHTSLGLATQVQHDLKQLGRICPLMESASKVRGQRFSEELDLLVPVGILRSSRHLPRYSSF